MRRLVLGRAFALAPTLLLASFGVFLLVQLAPGDPAITLAGENATLQQVQDIRRQLGFDQPLLAQYWNWLWHALHGNLGASFTTREDVVGAIGRTLPTTLQLVVGGLIVAVVLGVAAGVASARRANTAADAVIASTSAAGAAMPSFWLGLVLVSIFALNLGWLPATGFEDFAADPGNALRYLVLPSIALGIAGAAEIARQLSGR